MTGFDDATLAQIRAANPRASTWLSANAGSGKTRVLTNRVARLLLNGVRPENVLCLTFTKAAASEMQIRLFETLGAWAMLDDPSLREALERIGETVPDDLGASRTLFARAIETPGGLKIQTIHSFCSSLLRAFPLEAGVTPQFTEMDDGARDRLLAEIGDRLAETDPGGAFSAFARVYSGAEPLRLMADIARERVAFAGPVPSRAALLTACGAPVDLSEASIVSQVDADIGLLSDLRAALREGTPTERGVGQPLETLGSRALTWEGLRILESVFLTAKGTKRRNWPNNATKACINAEALDALMERVENARHWRVALEAVERTEALHHFARALLPLYEAEKSRRGLLDFDDLILKTVALLEDSDAAEWVLYRLDGGIEHILVDEAQDTSPVQWRVIELLTREMGAGVGARDVTRSLFVVGDKKQSIYSFQGADAAAFDKMQGFFRDRLRSSGGLNILPLAHSFRSAPAILKVVDQSFPPGEDVGLGRDTRHIPFFERLPGRVDLWPLVPAPKKEDHADWTEPVDGVAANHQAVVLAKTIAKELHRMIHVDRVMIPVARKKPLEPPEWRRMTEGDVLILVQGRQGVGELFQGLIRACKSEGLAIAGADRLRLSAELAVRDLRALLAFVALPEDSLSLAAVLRSPLFGWSEDDLFRLAHGRETRFLWRALQDRRAEFPATVEVLQDLRDNSDFLRPFELLERILVRHGGRRKLLARLGPESEDGIDELLTQAMRFETQEVPDLTRFLGWLEGEDTEIKRQADTAEGAIQVMTVHGAKGLERPVVILPDTNREKRGSRESFAVLGEAGAHWRAAKEDQPEGLNALFQMRDAAQQEERNRLLYVAMTRAESWLIVCGAESGANPDDAWYARVRDGMGRAGAAAVEMPTGPGLRLEDPGWAKAKEGAAEAPTPPAVPMPDWVGEAAPPAPEARRTIAPSSLPGDKSLPGEAAENTEEEALRKGRMMHRLLEHLPSYPRESHGDVAASLLAEGEDLATEAEARVLAEDTGLLLDNDSLQPIFAPGTLAEVEISADVPELGGRVHGAIDRLVFTEECILAVDFKTNTVVPNGPEDIPPGILRQQAAYLAALRRIYPHRKIEVAILWTATARLMPIPHDIVMDTLRDHAIS